MEKPFMVQQVIKFSDGTETVINYTDNTRRVEIEEKVAEAVALNREPEEDEVVVEEEEKEQETE